MPPFADKYGLYYTTTSSSGSARACPTDVFEIRVYSGERGLFSRGFKGISGVFPWDNVNLLVNTRMENYFLREAL
jgi:hypothetical protein